MAFFRRTLPGGIRFRGANRHRGTLKYRCPAAAYGLDCAGRERCLRDAGSDAGDYGRVVRVDLGASDGRMFTPTPWGSPSWRRGYNRRGALERINARLDGSFRFENHFVRGGAKMKTRLGLAVALMMALALGAVLADRPERMRSLVDPGCRWRPERRRVRRSATNRPRSGDALARRAAGHRPNENNSYLRGRNLAGEGTGHAGGDRSRLGSGSHPVPTRRLKAHFALESHCAFGLMSRWTLMPRGTRLHFKVIHLCHNWFIRSGASFFDRCVSMIEST